MSIEEQDEWEDEEKQRLAPSVRRIVACFKAVSQELGNDEAWRLFEGFVELKPQKRAPKTAKVHAEYNADLLRLYKQPSFKRPDELKRIASAHGKKLSSVQKQFDRLTEPLEAVRPVEWRLAICQMRIDELERSANGTSAIRVKSKSH